MRGHGSGPREASQRLCLRLGSALACFIVLGWAAPAFAQDAVELSKQTQNPVSSLISLPFQFNCNTGFGPADESMNLLNIQPVMPIHVGSWNLINRVIVPVVQLPEMPPVKDDNTVGLGDTLYSAFLSPAKPGKLIWGAGPAIQLPTASQELIGSEKWGLGPTAVALVMHGPWVVGALINNIWSVAGDDQSPDVNLLTLQYFINYNLSKGWAISSAPIITADWEADGDERWTIPMGAGVSRVYTIGKRPVKSALELYRNVVTPDEGPEWTIRAAFTLLFP